MDVVEWCALVYLHVVESNSEKKLAKANFF